MKYIELHKEIKVYPNTTVEFIGPILIKVEDIDYFVPYEDECYVRLKDTKHSFRVAQTYTQIQKKLEKPIINYTGL